MPKYQHFRLEGYINNRKVAFDALFDAESPKVTGGYGGWVTVQRPRRRALTEWTGAEPLRINLNFMLDKFVQDESVEGECRDLERLAGLDADMGEPPVLKMTADGAIPHDFHHASQNTWVIEELTWGDGSLRNSDGDRIRQAGSVTMMLYVRDEHIDELSSSKKNKKKARAKKRGTHRSPHPKSSEVSGKSYTVKKGDTLSSIAARLYHNANKWKDIADLNGIRDPNRISPGQHLKLP